MCIMIMLEDTGTDHLDYGSLAMLSVSLIISRFFKDSFFIHESDSVPLQVGDLSKTMAFVFQDEVNPMPSHWSCCKDYKVELPENNVQTVVDGDVFAYGDDKIEIVHLPGHTPGSIGVLSYNSRVLCTGDMLFGSAPMLDSIPNQGSRSQFSSSMEKIIDLITSEKVLAIFWIPKSIFIIQLYNLRLISAYLDMEKCLMPSKVSKWPKDTLILPMLVLRIFLTSNLIDAITYIQSR